MKCPYCGAEAGQSSRFCENCGANLQALREEQAQQSMQLVSNTGAMMGQEARRLRLEADYTGEEIISDRKYNLILVGTVLWGLLLNLVLVFTAGPLVAAIPPLALYIGYFILAFVGIRMAAKSRKPAVSFLGYNLLAVPLGLVLVNTVQYYLATDPQVVILALLYTALIVVGMLAAVTAFPQFFAKLGGMLLGCLLAMLLCEIVLLIFRVDQGVTDWIMAGIFSLYIGYDIYRSQQFVHTVDNAIDCALDIYLDIVNLFIRLLSLLSKKDRR